MGSSNLDPQPRYNHNCKLCRFLGYHEEYDLYICGHGADVLLTARAVSSGGLNSDEILKYGDALICSKGRVSLDPVILRAAFIACSKGYLSDKTLSFECRPLSEHFAEERKRALDREKAEAATERENAMHESTLPSWVLTSIYNINYQRYHHMGTCMVDQATVSDIRDFEEARINAGKS